jgi:hypothetical protein
MKLDEVIRELAVVSRDATLSYNPEQKQILVGDDLDKGRMLALDSDPRAPGPVVVVACVNY